MHSDALPASSRKLMAARVPGITNNDLGLPTLGKRGNPLDRIDLSSATTATSAGGANVPIHASDAPPVLLSTPPATDRAADRASGGASAPANGASPATPPHLAKGNKNAIDTSPRDAHVEDHEESASGKPHGGKSGKVPPGVATPPPAPIVQAPRGPSDRTPLGPQGDGPQLSAEYLRPERTRRGAAHANAADAQGRRAVCGDECPDAAHRGEK